MTKLRCLLAPPVAAALLLAPRLTMAATGDRVDVCARGSDLHRAALAQSEQIGNDIKALSPASDATLIRRKLTELLASPCFERARREYYRFDLGGSAISLSTWWEAGGESWIGSYLGPVYVEVSGDVSRDIWQAVIPPTVRRVLALETPGRPEELTPLLCPQDPGDCGTETRGWTRRADWSLRWRTASDRNPHLAGVFTPDYEEPCPSPAPEAEAGPYQAWRACVEAREPKGSALPLGAFQAPRAGWLLVASIRGHDDKDSPLSCRACDELRLYNLETGEAVVSHRCRCYDFVHGDDYVCSPEQYGERIFAVEYGRANVENLREAAWMLALAPHVEAKVRPRGRAFRVPAGLTPSWVEPSPDAEFPDLPNRPLILQSEWSHVTWAWERPSARISVAGRLPASYHDTDGEDYARELLQIAEASMRPVTRKTPVPKDVIAAVRARFKGNVAFSSLVDALSAR